MTNKPLEEYERVLMIVSEKPGDVMKQISYLDSVAGYRMTNSGIQDIHDIYFDTSERALSKHRLNLRIREKKGRTLVTLKQFPGKFSWKRNARRETEIEWSPETPDWIVNEMSNRGVDLRPNTMAQTMDSPLEKLKALGLEVVQDRETHRKTRNIVSSDGRILAEIALDNVTYHFREIGDLQLSELEIEAKSGDDGPSVVEQATIWLAEKFGTETRRWKSGKLKTGRLIEAQAKKGNLRGMIEDGRLTPEAYDLIARAT